MYAPAPDLVGGRSEWGQASNAEIRTFALPVLQDRSVTAPLDAVETSFTYFAMSPRL
jgi:hypothetical protein